MISLPWDRGSAGIDCCHFVGMLVSSFLLVAAQAVAGQVDAMGVVDEAIQDGVGVGWISDDVVPCRRRAAGW